MREHFEYVKFSKIFAKLFRSTHVQMHSYFPACCTRDAFAFLRSANAIFFCAPRVRPREQALSNRLNGTSALARSLRSLSRSILYG